MPRNLYVRRVIRDAFLDTSRIARELIASESVATAWFEPSALDGMTVGALAGHLSRAITLVEQYLDDREPPADAILLTAAGYFAGLPLSPDLDDDLNRQIRERGALEALDGPAPLVARVDAAITSAVGRLGAEPADRRITSFGGNASLLDEYLVTRIVELAVHLDDLAVSVALPTPQLGQVAWACALGCLFEIARSRHGDLAVLRALARRERDLVAALRIF
jgi:Mycothiol maleylpyruvate isomerase N-terminal domain